ncbi:MAG: ABC-2 transporter permease [Treponema sp.]|nr:ABC-2 transporter permease [Treponema sp.]
MNVTKLLKKEMKLETNLSIYCWLLCLFGFYFIPRYPVYIGCFYLTLAVMMTFSLNQVSHGIMYTVLLPVRKIDTVKARFLYCGLIELAFVPSAIIAAVVRHFCNYPLNPAGIDINVAYFGLQFIILAVFNYIFLGGVYKNPLKPGIRFLLGAIAYFVLYAVVEIPIWIHRAGNDFSLGAYLDMMDFAGQLKQIPVLAGGIIIWSLSWLITFKRAAKQFEKYDM